MKSMENISDQYLILIKKHHFANYNLTSGDYPTVICPSCKRCLRDRDKFGHDAKGKLPPLRYHKMRGTSRNFDECQCSWCPGVRSRVIEHVPAPPPEVKEICQGCLGEINRGVLHSCNVTSLEKNTLDKLKGMPSSSKQRMASTMTKEDLMRIKVKLNLSGKNSSKL